MRNWSCILLNKNQSPAIKNHQRKILRTQRAAIDANTRQTAALASAKILADSPQFKNAEHIACYLAQGSEFDLQPIIQWIWQSQKKCYLPVLTEGQDKSLHFITYEPDDHLKTNCYAIQEPVFSKQKEIPASLLDLVLVPLVGFDRTGHRLGSGSGYYDRTFAFLLQNPRPKQPCFLGVGYQAQELDHLASDAWDVTLDGILTEQGLFIFDQPKTK